MAHQGDLKSLVKEAELYRTQGLLEEAKDRYAEAFQLIKKNQRSESNKKAIKYIKDKIRGIEKDLVDIDEETEPPKLAGNQQDLIKKLFSFSQDKDSAEMEGAIALAKFGQYERALTEFKSLLRRGTRPLVAAKNILRCHLALSATEAAISQFREWLSGELLSKKQLRDIRSFLEYTLKRKGIQTRVPEVTGASHQRPKDTDDEGEFLDVCSVIIRLENGPSKGSVKELDVTFQSGNVISLIVSAKDRALIESFTPGIRLKGVHFCSSICVFKANGVVSEWDRIKTGPRRGDYVLSITIDRSAKLDIL